MSELAAAFLIAMIASVPWAGAILLIDRVKASDAPDPARSVTWKRFLIGAAVIGPAAFLLAAQWPSPAAGGAASTLLIVRPETFDLPIAPLAAAPLVEPLEPLVEPWTEALARWVSAPETAAFLLIVYLLGVAAFALRSVRAQNRLRRLLAAARPVTSPERLRAIWRHGRDLRGPDSPRILEIDQGVSPFVAGARCPTVVFPECVFRDLTDDQVSLVAAHEFEHVRRGDVAFGHGLRAVKALFWFNPFIHALCERADMAMETACDRAAVNHAPEARRAYAEALLRMYRAAAAPMATGGAYLVKRTLRREKMRLSLIVTPKADSLRTLATSAAAGGVRLTALGVAGSALAAVAVMSAQATPQDGEPLPLVQEAPLAPPPAVEPPEPRLNGGHDADDDRYSHRRDRERQRHERQFEARERQIERRAREIERRLDQREREFERQMEAREAELERQAEELERQFEIQLAALEREQEAMEVEMEQFELQFEQELEVEIQALEQELEALEIERERYEDQWEN
ncbi:MAG: M56 family metallopeptidase [Pseudomonadota bacterium]